MKGRPKRSTVISKKFYPRLLEDLSKNGIRKAKAKVLDIGCATGNLLKFLEDDDFETFGIDISEHAIEIAKSYCKKSKLYVWDVNNGLPMFKDNFFDAVIMFDIIEHLESPFQFLREVRRILKLAGIIVITTPNLNAIERLWMGEKWSGVVDKSHLYLFTPLSLRILVDRVGFNVVRLETPFFPLPKFIRKIADKTGLGGSIWLTARK
jgi:2-polyprenyl-3-methyl-5-hydroxy-6-metoxy-1,4-benzoquinol methylase